jgi:hypothetical protein
MHSHNAASAGLGWEVWGLGEASVFVLETDKPKTYVLPRCFYCVGRRGSYGHSEALRQSVVRCVRQSMADLGKSGNLLVAIGVEVLLCIVDGYNRSEASVSACVPCILCIATHSCHR